MRACLCLVAAGLAGCVAAGPVAPAVRPESLPGLRLDCIPPEGTMGGDAIGWSVIVDYSTSTVNWFGLLSANGSFDYALVTGAPAEISATTIKWHRRVRWQGKTPSETISINRSTGTLYYEDIHGSVLTAQCNPYQGPPPARF